MDPSENCEIKVSVIMPIYNAYDYLRPAIDSVLDQTLREIEIICVDDGSTDHSFDIIKEYQKTDDRIRVLTETNAGPALARNNGLKRARGEYVAFFDADDFFDPACLEKLYETAKRDDLDIAIARYDIYNSKKSVFRPGTHSDHGEIFEPGKVTSKNEYPDVIFQSTTGAAWNKLFRRSFILEKNLSFLEEIKMFEDVYFVVTALSLAERVGKVFEVLVHHRVHSEQSRSRLFRKYYAQVPIVYGKIKEFLMHNGMYAPLSRGFLNMSVSRCYKIYNLLWHDAKAEFWDLLHGKYVEKLGWADRTSEDFELAETCEFCANVQMYSHAQYQARTARGLRLRLDRLKTTFTNARRNKKIGAFFARVRNGIVRFFRGLFGEGKKKKNEDGK